MQFCFLLYTASFLLFKASAQHCNVPSAERQTCGNVQETYLTCPARPLCCYDYSTGQCYRKRASSSTLQAEYFRALSLLQRVQKPPNFNPVIQAAQTSNSFILPRNLNFTFASIFQQEFPQCPVRVPFCHRTKCGQHPSSESNPSQCNLDPSCCFDQDLFVYKNMFGSSYMAGVPVCYHGVTSIQYLQLVGLVQPWSSYFHPMMTDAFSSAFGSSQQGSCSTSSFPFFPKNNLVCGWKGITPRECRLRGCCYDSTTATCVYPSTLNQFNPNTNTNSYHPELTTHSPAGTQCQSQNNIGQDIYRRLPCLHPGEGVDATSTLLQCPQTQCCIDYSAALPNTFGPRPPVGNPFFPFGQLTPGGLNNNISSNPFLLAALTSQPNQPAGFPGFAFPQQCPYLFTPFPGLPDLTPFVLGCCERHACYHKKKFQSLQLPGQTSGPGSQARPPFYNQGPSIQQPYVQPNPPIQPYTPPPPPTQPYVNPVAPQQPFVNPGPPQQPYPGLPQSPNVNNGPAGFSDWTLWSGWTACSATCGHGRRSQHRTCRRNNNCAGPPQRSENCYIADLCPQGPGPRSFVWKQWGDWNDCSITCGFGTQLKVRKCIDRATGLAAPDSNSCGDERLMIKVCNRGPCTNSSWGPWSDFSECTATCNRPAIQRRTRNCLENNIKVNYTQCTGSPQSRKLCRVTECIKLGEWQEWEACSASCGSGVQRRVRPCSNDTIKINSNCSKEIIQTRNCSSQCPNDVIRWGDWGEWEPCPVSCGNALKKRSRTCTVIGLNTILEASLCTDLLDTPQQHERKLCIQPSCFKWSPWSNYSECSVTCGNGTQTSERNCLESDKKVLSVHCLGSATRQRPCQGPPCGPRMAWTPWSQCTATCGKGNQLRFRCIPQDDGTCEIASIEFYKRSCIGLPSC